MPVTGPLLLEWDRLLATTKLPGGYTWCDLVYANYTTVRSYDLGSIRSGFLPIRSSSFRLSPILTSYSMATPSEPLGSTPTYHLDNKASEKALLHG